MNDKIEKSIFSRNMTTATMLLFLAGLMSFAGLCYWGYGLACRKLEQVRVESTLPKLADALCSQRQRLVTTISAYHQNLGLYPPDHVLSERPVVVDTVTNQLFYE